MFYFQTETFWKRFVNGKPPRCIVWQSWEEKRSVERVLGSVLIECEDVVEGCRQFDLAKACKKMQGTACAGRGLHPITDEVT